MLDNPFGIVKRTEDGVYFTMASTPHKTCKHCGQCKPLTDFYKHAAHRDGHFNKCIKCVLAYTKARYDANPEAARAAKKASYRARKALRTGQSG